MKYEAMVEKNRKKNAAKEELAIRAIRKMEEAGERVTVKKLVKKTGLSASLFYHNQNVKDELNKTKKVQIGSCYVKEEQNVINQALYIQVQMLKNEIRKLREIESKKTT